jgi:glycosyltransferase involved in cell wall biosynthesis
MASPRKIALIHDWLTGMRGGEKVLEVLCELFPSADIYTLLHAPGQVSPLIERHKIVTSYLQKIPGIIRTYRYFLPFMPGAIEKFDFSDYDLMISTSHCVAKGAIPGPRAQHWSYCHTPMRYVWDQFPEYFGPGRASLLTRAVMKAVRPYLQKWDIRTAGRVHHYLANSENVKERIQRIYHRESCVVYPPVDYAFFSERRIERDQETPPPFYLIVSALVPYKRVDLAVKAFNKLEKQLLIIGQGPEYKRLRDMAGPNIHFSGWANEEQLRWNYSRCQALLFPGEEDFGIVPLEAMSAGRPIIAFRKGGALETVVEGKTGLFFDKQSPEALLLALQQLESRKFNVQDIQRHASQFSRQRCLEEFRRTFVAYTPEMS